MGQRVDTAPGPESFQTLERTVILRRFLRLCRGWQWDVCTPRSLSMKADPSGKVQQRRPAWAGGQGKEELLKQTVPWGICSAQPRARLACGEGDPFADVFSCNTNENSMAPATSSGQVLTGIEPCALRLSSADCGQGGRAWQQGRGLEEGLSGGREMPSVQEEHTVQHMPGRARGRSAKLVLPSHHKEEVVEG